MLIFLSQMVNRFTEQYLDMVIEVNLTVMLVLATLWVLFSQVDKTFETGWKCENVSAFLGSASRYQPPPTSSWLRSGWSSPWFIPLLRLCLSASKICTSPKLFWWKVYNTSLFPGYINRKFSKFIFKFDNMICTLYKPKMGKIPSGAWSIICASINLDFCLLVIWNLS